MPDALPQGKAAASINTGEKPPVFGTAVVFVVSRRRSVCGCRAGRMTALKKC